MNIFEGMIIAVGSSLVTALILWLISKIKGIQLSRQINILMLRTQMRNIYKDCKRDGKRDAADTKTFYDMHEVYVKNLKQNSYICNVIEPAFRNIKEEN